MKKLIVAAAIVCVSVVAQAATYSWKAYNDWYSPDGNDDLAGKVYLFDGSIYAQDAMIASIASGNLDGLANNIASTALGAGGFLLTGTGLTDDGAATPYAHMYAIIMNDGNTEYFASEVVNTKISDAIDIMGTILFKPNQAFGEGLFFDNRKCKKRQLANMPTRALAF